MHAQLCSTLCNSMNFSTPGSSVHGIFQAGMLEWIAISSSNINVLLMLFMHVFFPLSQLCKIFFVLLFILEKEMATHSSILAWRIPRMEKPGASYRPWGNKESDTTERFHFTFIIHFKNHIVDLKFSLSSFWVPTFLRNTISCFFRVFPTLFLGFPVKAMFIYFLSTHFLVCIWKSNFPFKSLSLTVLFRFTLRGGFWFVFPPSSYFFSLLVIVLPKQVTHCFFFFFRFFSQG